MARKYRYSIADAAPFPLPNDGDLYIKAAIAERTVAEMLKRSDPRVAQWLAAGRRRGKE